jgi:2-keto-4-pentenoate hydratase/2-oxohepta-3-ene-1,7-dioic acid hydratase in catechol pathway
MRLLAFQHRSHPSQASHAAGNHTCIGVRHDDHIIDLTALADPQIPRDIPAILAGGSALRELIEKSIAKAPASAVVNPDAIIHQLPIPRPDKNIGLGKNYLNHVKEMGAELPTFPGMFFRIPESMVAHNQPIWRPKLSDTLDYEGELMVIIGKQGKDIPRERALDYVGGYTCHNDGSIREYNRIPSALSSGKNFPHTGSMGPEIVTADELPRGCKGLQLQTHVNGELRQNANISDMHWGVADLISLMSGLFTLYPGDILSTGTPGGVAAGFKPPKWLVPGDEVTVTIDEIGTLRNSIEDAPASDSQV